MLFLIFNSIYPIFFRDEGININALPVIEQKNTTCEDRAGCFSFLQFSFVCGLIMKPHNHNLI